MSSPASRIGSLLVIDDNLIQRTQVIALCRNLGVRMIYEAASGLEALELLALLVLPPDVLILDLEMPGMDGVELIQQLQERQLAIPLVLASSREIVLIQTVETIARNLGLPVLAAVHKPVSRESLHTAFARLVGRAAAEAKEPADAASGDGGPAPPVDVQALAEAVACDAIGVHYQPKIDMATGALRGFEALARWRDAAARDVRPDLFIPVAESAGLIHALTMSVMARAMAQLADWNAAGLKVTMAVNLSPRVLEAPSLVEDLAAMAACYAVPAQQVVLELTESSVVDCMGMALGVLARLRLRGFGLSIDDYGTGFSSMQQLARIPFTELKIDRSFVHGAHARTNLRVILQSALEMARQLGLVSVAEGIETPQDWQLAQGFGCCVGQGFLTARPMPAADFPHWLEGHRRRQPGLREGTAALRATGC